jgi:hypothetical protein
MSEQLQAVERDQISLSLLRETSDLNVDLVAIRVELQLPVSPDRLMHRQ